MTSLCKYKNIFGEPLKGAHAYRILNVPIVDAVGTVALAYVTTKLHPSTSFIMALVFWLVVAAALHSAFCVKTPLSF